MAGTLRAVLFDAAGTLLRLREPVGATYARFAAGAGARAPASRLDEAFARALAAAEPPAYAPGVALAEAAARERAFWRRVVEDTFRAADASALPREPELLFERLFAHYATEAAWELAPGAREALLALRARGLATGVVSNFDQRLRTLLGRLAIHHLLDVVVLPADAGAAKPDRAIFEVALKRLGLAAAHVAYVGDHAERDQAGARAAGLRPVDARPLATLAELPAALGLAPRGGAPPPETR